MKISSLKSDLQKVENGVWISDIPYMGDLRLKVRPIGMTAWSMRRRGMLSVAVRSLTTG